MISVFVGFFGLVFVAYLSARVVAKETGNATMQELSGYIYEGAMAFLSREYQAIGVFAVAVTILLGLGIGWAIAVAYTSARSVLWELGLSACRSPSALMFAPLRLRRKALMRLWM